MLNDKKCMMVQQSSFLFYFSVFSSFLEELNCNVCVLLWILKYSNISYLEKILFVIAIKFNKSNTFSQNSHIIIR